MSAKNTRAILRITGLYALIAILWITLSDQLMIRITAAPANIAALSILKGWMFVLVTALLLAILLRHEFSIRSEAEQARQVSENLYRELADSITDIFFALDADLRYIFWNKASERFTGIPAHQALGKSLTDLFPAMAETEIVSLYQRVLSGRQAQSMVHAYIHEGQQFYFEINAYPSAIGVFVHARDVTERRRREREMEAIASVTLDLRTAASQPQMLSVILEQTLELLDAEGDSIAIPNPQTGELIIEAGAGKSAAMAGYIFPPGQGIVGSVFQSGEAYHSANVYEDPRLFTPDTVFAPAVACFPLISTGHVITGVLWVNRVRPFDAEDLRILKITAEIAANAIHRANIFENLQQTNLELSRSYDETIQGWSSALDLRDRETEGHTLRVADLTLKLAQVVGIGAPELIHIRRGSLLHDIGKMGIPDAILHKPGPLEPAEWEIMRQHPDYAYRLLSPIAYLRPALDIPYCHHEKWDGSGYPRGLKGEEIPLAARLFALVDVWDALRSDRPYRMAYNPETAIQYIREQAGKHFDPLATQIFLDYIQT